jgi:AcrR family transcriptional regulator
MIDQRKCDAPAVEALKVGELPTGPGEGRRAHRKLLTQGRILDAAAQVFAARGFEGATVREIAQRAGATQPLVVYHFGSKDALWRTTVDRLWRRLVEEARAGAAPAATADSPEVVRAVLRSFIGVVAREPSWLQILLREATEPGSRLAWLVEHQSRDTYAAGVGFLESAQQNGLLPALPPRHLLFVLVGALTFVIAIAPEIRHVTGEDVRSADFLDRHVSTFMALLLPASLASGANAHADELASDSETKIPESR